MRMIIFLLMVWGGFLVPEMMAQPYIREKVFVHTDRDLYLTGEKIRMKVYVTDAAFNHPTPFSKVAYLELWGPDGLPIEQLRFPLFDGKADISLLLDRNLHSGYYQLRAYTRWMLNGSAEDFFLLPLAVLNPEEEIPLFDESVENLPEIPNRIKAEASDSLVCDIDPLAVVLSLSPEKTAVGTRVVVNIHTLDVNGNPLPANISLSVAKKSPIPFGFSEKEEEWNPLDRFCRPVNPVYAPEKLTFLPELFGMLVSGTVFGPENKAYSEAEVYLAIPGKIPHVKWALADSKGRFYFNLPDRYGVGELVVFATDSSGSHLRVKLDPVIAAAVPPPFPLSLSFSQKDTQLLKELFLNHQIQTAYEDEISVSKDLPTKPPIPFYGIAERTYRLDDYTRFSIEETFIEIIYQVHVLHREGKTLLRIYDQYADAMLEGDPMMLVDGIPFLNAENLLAINSRKIEQVDVLSTRYFSDNRFMDGMVHLITYEGRGDAVKLPDHYLRQNYSFYTPGSAFIPVTLPETPDFSVPDFRNLLHWEPNIVTDSAGKARVEFYTSAAAGKYEVRVVALTSDGLGGKTVKTLEVVYP
ncbi:MAG: hypothetical protein SF052_09085 [Bacteroidia bacterium]|nr:hypothetical protein [Bacteroidia bacterium]